MLPGGRFPLISSFFVQRSTLREGYNTQETNRLRLPARCAIYTTKQAMTNYHLTSTTLPSLAAQEAKQERKHLLEQIRKRRYQQEKARRKRQQQAYSSNEEYQEYQQQLQEEAKLYR